MSSTNSSFQSLLVVVLTLLGCGQADRTYVVQPSPQADVPPTPTEASNVQLPTDRVTLKVRCRKMRSSGKRHNSYWFTFDVVTVLVGNFTSQTVSLEELFSGFGGSQLRSRLSVLTEFGPTTEAVEVACENDVTLRIILSPSGDSQLLWSAAEAEREQLEQLELLLWRFQQALESRRWSAMAALLGPTSLFRKETFDRLLARQGDKPWPAIVGLVGMRTFNNTHADEPKAYKLWLDLETELTFSLQGNVAEISSIDF